VSALRHALITEVVRQGLGPQVAWNYRRVVFEGARASLERMRWHCLRGTRGDSQREFIEGIFSFDNDKLAHVLVGTDPLMEWDANTVSGQWRDDGLVGRIDSAIRSASELMFHSENRINAVLHLIVLQGVGRASAFGFHEPPRHRQAYLKAMS